RRGRLCGRRRDQGQLLSSFREQGRSGTRRGGALAGPRQGDLRRGALQQGRRSVRSPSRLSRFPKVDADRRAEGLHLLCRYRHSGDLRDPSATPRRVRAKHRRTRRLAHTYDRSRHAQISRQVWLAGQEPCPAHPGGPSGGFHSRQSSRPGTRCSREHRSSPAISGTAVRPARRKAFMKSSYGWVIVAVGALMTCVGIGAMFSLAVYLAPMSADTGWSRTGISSAMTLDFLVMGVASFGWGAASDRFGTRIVVLTGAVMLGLGLLLASRATSLIEFQLTYGILVGLAAGSFFAPMIAATTTWFESNRSLAVSLVSAGMGVAPMTISPFARWLISTYDWRVAMLTIGIAAWFLLVPAALLVRRPAE